MTFFLGGWIFGHLPNEKKTYRKWAWIEYFSKVLVRIINHCLSAGSQVPSIIICMFTINVFSKINDYKESYE